MGDSAVDTFAAQIEALTTQASERLAATPWGERDLARLLALCLVPNDAIVLAELQDEACQLAEAHTPLEGRLTSLEEAIEALGEAIDATFGAEPGARLAAHARLRAARRAATTVMARGAQQGLEALAQQQRDRVAHEQGRLQAVERINRFANSTLDIDEVLANAAQTISEELSIDLCAIFLHDQLTNELLLRATSANPKGTVGHHIIRLGEQLTGAVAQRGMPGTARDLDEWAIKPLETQIFGPDYRGIYVMPIICFSGESSTLEGTLTLLKKTPLTLTDEERNFLELIAGQLALSIENSKVYHHAEEARLRQFANIAMLQSISATVATSFDLTRVLQMIISSAVQMSSADHGAIFLFDEESGTLRLAAHHHLNEPSLREVTVKVGDCCVGRAVEQGDRIWDMDCLHQRPDCYLRHLSDQMHEIHTSLAVPLMSKGLVKGVMHLLSRDRHMQASIQARMVETFANEAAIAIESTRLYEETRSSLELRSRLYQEMHHRVKNNLLSIAAILRMERRRTTSPEAMQVLSESVSRIDGMAATHDLLSNEDHIGTANISDIATKLIGVVSAYLVPPELKVKFETLPSDVEVHSKKALVLALIINELLANAIEHGMADRAHGRVRIAAWEAAEQVHFVVADDGADLPSDLDLTNSNSLGLVLVRDMTRNELRGSFQLGRGPLPPPMRGDPADETPWTLAELIFLPEREAPATGSQHQP